MTKQKKQILIGGAVMAAILLLSKSNKKITGIAGSGYTDEQLSANFKSDMIEVTKQFYHYQKNKTLDSSLILASKTKALLYWADEIKKYNK
jgi:predicted ATP-grasp superfamily ATP-dependent carboligase